MQSSTPASSTASSAAGERGAVRLGEVLAAEAPRRRQHWARLIRLHPLGAISAVIMLVLVFLGIFGPWIVPYDPLEQNPALQAKAPTAEHIMGTDNLGRDVFSRIIVGARVSLWVGIVSVTIGVVAGTALGLLSGYFKGVPDLIIQRLMDIVLAFPGLLLALAIMAILGTSITNVMLAVGVVMTPGVSRVVRSVVLSVRELQYIEAARSLGANDTRILLRHVLPNIVAPIIVVATVGLGSAILIEASLSFLGMGTQPPEPSWGNMLSGPGRQFFETAPWMAIYPGLALSLAVLAFNLLGDSLRDLLDPRLRGKA